MLVHAYVNTAVLSMGHFEEQTMAASATTVLFVLHEDGLICELKAEKLDRKLLLWSQPLQQCSVRLKSNRNLP